MSLRLSHGELTAEIDAEWGARMLSLRAGARDILAPVTTPRPETPWEWPAAGAFPLIPFGGRIRDNRIGFMGSEFDLSGPPSGGMILHGCTARRAWRVERSATSACTLSFRHDGDAEWPWAFDTRMTCSLGPKSLRVDIAIENSGSAPIPGAIGWHPSFTKADRIEGPAARKWAFDAALVPDLTQPRMADALYAGHLTLAEAAQQFDLRLMNGTLISVNAEGDLHDAVIHDLDDHRTCIEPISFMPISSATRAFPVIAPGAMLLGMVRVDIS